MAVELPLYALPIPGGCALAAPPLVVRTLSAAGHVLAQRPQRSQISVLVPEGTPPGMVVPAARDVLRRAAVRELVTPPSSRHTLRVLPRPWHLVLVVTGALLILDSAGSVSQALAGAWLALLYPFLHSRTLAGQASHQTEPLDALATALEEADVEVRPHAGLSLLAARLGHAPHQEQPELAYERLAGVARRLGLDAIADVYAAVSQGVHASVIWSPLVIGGTAEGDTRPALLQAGETAPPAETVHPLEGEEQPRTSSTLSLT